MYEASPGVVVRGRPERAVGVSTRVLSMSSNAYESTVLEYSWKYVTDETVNIVVEWRYSESACGGVRSEISVVISHVGHRKSRYRQSTHGARINGKEPLLEGLDGLDAHVVEDVLSAYERKTYPNS